MQRTNVVMVTHGNGCSGAQVEKLRTEETIEGAEESQKASLEEERGVEGLAMSLSTGFHRHGATRHAALHLTA